MAASRTVLLLLGLVVLSTVLVATEASQRCKCGGKQLNKWYGKPMPAVPRWDLTKCSRSLNLKVAVFESNVYKRCPGGQVTQFEPLKLLVDVHGYVKFKVQLWDKHGDKVLVNEVVTVNILVAVYELVGDNFFLELVVDLDVTTRELVFWCANKEILRISITLKIWILLGLGLPGLP